MYDSDGIRGPSHSRGLNTAGHSAEPVGTRRMLGHTRVLCVDNPSQRSQTVYGSHVSAHRSRPLRIHKACLGWGRGRRCAQVRSTGRQPWKGPRQMFCTTAKLQLLRLRRSDLYYECGFRLASLLAGVAGSISMAWVLESDDGRPRVPSAAAYTAGGAQRSGFSLYLRISVCARHFRARPFPCTTDSAVVRERSARANGFLLQAQK